MARSGPYILLADDDPDDQEMFIERFLRQNPGVHVELVDNGLRALAHLQSCAPGELPVLMVLDYKMPGLTGPEVLRSIQSDARFRNIGKIVWSTSGHREYIDKCIGYGADVYYTKPCDLAGLYKIIDRVSELFRARSVL